MSNSRQRDDTSKQGQLNSSPLARKFGGVDSKENLYEPESGNGSNLLQTPIEKTRDASWNDSQLITPPYSSSNSQVQSQPCHDQQSSLASTISPAFTFSFDPQASTSANKTPSHWESRARSASPAASLARHAADGREKKKSQFLDRIRRRRDDSRADNTGDQVLRMDFVNERRVWEDEMRRRAVLEQNANPEIDLDLEMDAEMMQDSANHVEMPPTDENDIDQAELALYFEEMQSKNRSQEFLVDDIDGDEYDALFIEVLSQGQNPSFDQAQTQTQNAQPAQQQHPQDLRDDQQPFDSSMDLS